MFVLAFWLGFWLTNLTKTHSIILARGEIQMQIGKKENIDFFSLLFIDTAYSLSYLNYLSAVLSSPS